ncbi:hypothetical protein [Archangium sp.]|uniref:hypothetical protein n=1 Tax=Archangium sp. TaxID=1872627 RepID=UPI002D512904|nr:hypothetical protein [Archangium sp.]HYO58490.1 hypothetical protein [Archangium sp.]
MTRVHLVTEDRTGGGLAAVLCAEAEHQRKLCGKARLQFSAKPSTVNGNAELLKQCEKYELFRFNYSPRCDHVFYVIDARNAWDLPQLKVQAPSPPYEQSLPAFIHTICGRLAEIARGSRTEQQWAAISSGFHAHVLVWERESLILPVADRLGLGNAVMEVYTARRAAESVGDLFRGLGKRRKYDKAIDGPEYLQRIADDVQLRAIVLESNPSLRTIVDELVSL